MLIGIAAPLGDLLNPEGRRGEQLPGRLHPLADENVDKGLTRVFFDAGAQMVGADVQHSAEGDQGEVRLHIVLIQNLQGPLAQQAPSLHRRGQITDKLGPAFGPVPLAQHLHGLPVRLMEGRQGSGRTAHPDPAAAAQHPLGHLGDLVGQNMEILVKSRRVAQQH